MKNVVIAGIGIIAIVLAALLMRDDEQTVAVPDTPTADTSTEDKIRAATATLDGDRIINADSEPGNWLAHGRTYDESRYSPLKQINDTNVSQMGLAWYFDTGTDRGLEASPIVVDGVMYTSGSWSVVFANDARTGELIWKHDPKVPREWGAKACCDVVNRGVAVWKGRVYVGTIDGRLVALDAATGEVKFDVNTIDRTLPYTITGAPRIVKDKVIIGNGGAEYGVRGYVTAYNTTTGEQEWRFYTVPGNPADGFESPAMEMAAKTWTGQWWEYGGGGTVWDSMAYDPDLNLLYIGVGNGSPWNQTVRSPGGGDNLFLSSIVALNPDTGEYVWHYQTTPGDSWDYTATQHMILTDLEINGEMRKVIMQAPKNGFFYVVDRETGEFISAKPYIPISWATHVDPESGRPVETENARYQAANPLSSLSLEDQIAALKSMTPDQLEQAFHKPSPYGGHNWHPMSYSPDTGLVYIPALDIPFAFGNEPQFTYEDGRWNLAIDIRLNNPVGDKQVEDTIDGMIRGYVAAWDPVEQKEVWRIQHAGSWNGGMLSTAGNLIFQGTSHGEFRAYRADTGEQLWSAEAQTGVIAPPVTFTVDGEQYVTVVAGWGGAFPLAAGGAAEKIGQKNRGRILTFKLGGDKQLPPVEPAMAIPEPPEMTGTPEQITHGKVMYGRYCGVCHGAGVKSGGVLPDLRHMQPAKHLIFKEIVLDGILKDNGMVSFADVLNEDDVEAIHAYVIAEAHRMKAEQ
ncbi:MAG: PQQ-dependent dehydrogenase, methanol/ethanol family [Pseudomonadales bacterium]|nr:PQQ-dependent dehydrogenase, methanol/ethanol family [Pseudomonadales bacterium]